MTATRTNAQAEYATIDPWVISRDTEAEIAFLVGAFGAEERPGRMLDDDGRIAHVEVQIDGSVIMLFDSQDGWPALPAHLRVYVENIEIAFARSLSLGARAVTEPTELFWGDRVARVRDEQGHLWWVFQRGEPLDEAALAARQADPAFATAMAYVQDSLAEELDGAPR
jgi:PhnB protein